MKIVLRSVFVYRGMLKKKILPAGRKISGSLNMDLSHEKLNQNRQEKYEGISVANQPSVGLFSVNIKPISFGKPE